jgi:PAS domain-containing protein
MTSIAPEAPDIELLRLAVDLSPAGTLAVDDTGSILLANRKIQQLFGYSSAELLGSSAEMLVPPRYRSAQPGFRDHCFSAAAARASPMRARSVPAARTSTSRTSTATTRVA